MLMTQQEFQRIVEQINAGFQEQFNRLDAFEKRLQEIEKAQEEKPKTRTTTRKTQS